MDVRKALRWVFEMRKFVIALSVLCVIFLLTRGYWQPSRTVAEEITTCNGTRYEGAWFEVQIPAGMTVIPSSPSSTGEGSDSIWVRSDADDTEFYLYAPQWGGTPYDIFLGVSDRQELAQDERESRVFSELQLQYENSVGRYETEQSTDPVSHRTIGFRNKSGALSDEDQLRFNCFKESIIQFSD